MNRIEATQIEARTAMRERIVFPSNDGRLTIKQLIVPDAQAIWELIEPDLPELRLFGHHTGLKCTDELSTSRWIQGVPRPDEDHNEDEIRFGLWNQGGKIVGALSLEAYKTDKRAASITGYMGIPYQRHGYMESGLRSLMDYSFANLGYSELRMQVDRYNDASIGLLRKMGLPEVSHRFMPSVIEFIAVKPRT